MSPDELGSLFPILLSEPCEEWTARYRIDHIGSTAIPGLISKPTIDILVQIHTDTPDKEAIDALKRLGYLFLPKPENPAPHMLYVKGYTKDGFRGQAFHVHIRYAGDWDEIWFRDYLRSHPESREEYVHLKQKLAIEFRNDRDGYTDAKTGFIEMINQAARAQAIN